MNSRSAHVHDDDLLALYFRTGPAAESSTLVHLAGCETCAARWDRLVGSLETTQKELWSEADETFTTDRLSHQREQIRRRLDSLGRQAKVIEFPAASGQRHAERAASRVAMRWVAAAAAAGLLVGLGTGVLIDRRSQDRIAMNAIPTRGLIVGAPSRNDLTNRALNEDQFLSDVEAALDASHAPALQALDDFTPRIQEIAVTLR